MSLQLNFNIRSLFELRFPVTFQQAEGGGNVFKIILEYLPDSVLSILLRLQLLMDLLLTSLMIKDALCWSLMKLLPGVGVAEGVTQ